MSLGFKSLSFKKEPSTPIVGVPLQTQKGEKEQMKQYRSQLMKMERELDMHDISAVQFSLYTTQEIDNLARVVITTNLPNGPGSVRDPRFGPVDEFSLCGTCGKDITSCEGHYGAIVIPKLMNPHFVQHIIHILSIVCNTCGRLLFTKEELEEREEISKLPAIKRIQKMYELNKAHPKICPNVSAVDKSGKERPVQERCSINPTYNPYKNKDNKHDYQLSYTYLGSTKTFAPRSPNDIWNILNVISDEDCRLMGFQPFTHPRNMIMERVVVIPYNARPDTFQGSGVGPDTLTLAYQDIFKLANDYFNASSDVSRNTSIRNLYNKIIMIFINDEGYGTNGSGQFTSLKERVQGKKAIIRFNIMGKRANFTARTVIVPGYNIRADEVGIPQLMTPKLTLPVTVNSLNKEELQTLYEKGMVSSIKHRSKGGKSVINEEFRRVHPNYKLAEGDEVNRWLQNGDYVIINRQPSLSKFNMLKFNVKLVKERTMRLPLPVTKCYNADFDGDEMNIYVCQAIKAYSEANNVLGVEHNIIGHDNLPVIGPVYDSLTGCYLLTYPATVRPDFDIEKYINLEKKIEELEGELRAVVKDWKDTISKQGELMSLLISDKKELPEGASLFIGEIKEINSTIQNKDAITAAYLTKNMELYNTLVSQLDISPSEQINIFSSMYGIPKLIGLKDKLVEGLVRSAVEKKRKESILKELSDLNNSLSKLRAEMDEKNTLLEKYRRLLLKTGEGVMLDKIVFDRAIAVNKDRPQMKTLKERLEKYHVPWGSGRSLISSCLPEKFYYEKKTDENHVIIKNGVLIDGYLDKSVVGISDGSIIAEMVKSDGGAVTVEFITSIQFIVSEYLQNRGFTIGYFDCAILDEDFAIRVKTEMVRTEVSLSGLMMKPENPISAQKQERDINDVLKLYTGNIKELANDYLTRDPNNSMQVMARSGAKGSMTNITQISISVGQQRIEGKRPQPTLPGYRCLPIFRPEDSDPSARGMVFNSYNTGMNPGEYYFHLQGSREGVIDTGINTAKTGDLQHKLIKAQEDIAIAPDGSVRSTDGAIVQFVYLNGFDPTKLTGVHIGGTKKPFFRNLKNLANRINQKYM